MTRENVEKQRNQKSFVLQKVLLVWHIKIKLPNKMDSFLQIVIFSVVMLFGSYLAGSVPLFISMSENNLHLVSVMGAGLLVGVALAVIMPEGIQTLITAFQLKSKTHHEGNISYC